MIWELFERGGGCVVMDAGGGESLVDYLEFYNRRNWLHSQVTFSSGGNLSRAEFRLAISAGTGDIGIGRDKLFNAFARDNAR